ncbi:MAG: site-specific integrase [Spirochaetia bacterium]|jgi:integrase
MNELVPSIQKGMERFQAFNEHVKDWDDFVKRFVLYGQGLSSNTYDGILSTVRVFFDVWSRTQNRESMMLHPAEITAAHLDLFYDWYCSKSANPVSGRRSATIKMSYLRSFFKRLELKFPFFASPFDDLGEQLRKKFSGPRGVRRDRTLTRGEINRLALYCKNQKTLRGYYTYCLIRTLYKHGFRIFELCQLRWDQITTDANGVQRASFIGKGNKNAEQALDKKCFEELRKLRSYCSYDGPYMFPPIPTKVWNPKTTMLTVNSAEELFIELAKEVNAIPLFSWKVRLNPHSFRHALGDYLYRQGFTVQQIAKVLRHSDIQTTYEYYCTAEPPAPDEYMEK